MYIDMTARHWVWTLNNYTDDEVEALSNLVADLAVRYIC